MIAQTSEKGSNEYVTINPFSTRILWKIGITKKAKHLTLNASISKTKTNSE